MSGGRRGPSLPARSACPQEGTPDQATGRHRYLVSNSGTGRSIVAYSHRSLAAIILLSGKRLIYIGHMNPQSFSSMRARSPPCRRQHMPTHSRVESPEQIFSAACSNHFATCPLPKRAVCPADTMQVRQAVARFVAAVALLVRVHLPRVP